jgi:hypothetical protein
VRSRSPGWIGLAVERRDDDDDDDDDDEGLGGFLRQIWPDLISV